MLYELSYWALELLGLTELLGSVATWPVWIVTLCELSYWATELLGSMVPWLHGLFERLRSAS